MAETHHSLPLTGQVSIVTGSNTGIGKETALGLAKLGSKVIMGCRSYDRAMEAKKYIHSKCDYADVEILTLDLRYPSSIQSFVENFNKKNIPLHILVNNAGANFKKRSYTEEGIGLCAQINFLGPYALTRLLEPNLTKSAPSRVVNVSSIMHRYGKISNPKDFLKKFEHGSYSNCKLANVIFSHEIHRRWRSKGISSAAVDPGSVSSDIWRKSLFSKPPLKWVIQGTYAPPWDGAKAVLHAASTQLPYPQMDRKGIQNHSPLFAKGIFASPFVTQSSNLGLQICSPIIVLLASLDWPIRYLSGGRFLSFVKPVSSSFASQNLKLGSELWDEAARATGFPLD